MKVTRVAGPCMGVLLVLGLAACGAQRFEYQEPGEIPEGEGMFTGEDGSVDLSIGDDAGETATQSNNTATAAVPADCACPEGAELEAYREFLRWKADAVGTPEYQEFQDWRAWRRERSGSE